MLYDTHSHPYLAKNLSQETIIENFFNTWGTHINSIWCDIKSSQASISLAKKYNWVYATIWIHPTHTLEYLNRGINDIISELESLYHKNTGTVVAIWEIWLDYYWIETLAKKHNITQDDVRKIQKEYFKAQIDLASRLWLPIVIHNRESSEDILTILKETSCKNFVFHCFSEDLDYAHKLTDIAPDCKLWFWGIVTFKNAQKTQEVASKIDLKHIIIETDSPYLTPEPYRWKRENEPILVKEVLSKIIDLRTESSETITDTVFQNSTDFFQIKK